LQALDDVRQPPSDAPDDSFLGFITSALGHKAAQNAKWRLDCTPKPSDMWLRVNSDQRDTPKQGWKLHISATVASATTVLGRVLPLLLVEDASFKVAASVNHLRELNEDNDSLSQIGKFITIYPRDNAQAVRLAAALDEATRGLRGPSILSDRPLVPGSLVHYRYGGFDDRHIQTPLGFTLPAISTPEGALVADERRTVYSPPEWVADPFVQAGIAAPIPATNPLIGRRYLIVSTLHESARGAVYRAADIDKLRSCILKCARHDALSAADGTDARARLSHEADVLAFLAPDPRFPAVFDLLEQEGDLFMVMEDLEGDTLETHAGNFLRQGRFPPRDQVIAWGRELAAALGTIHAKGLVYGDVKSSNVMVAPNGSLRLFDFDIAYRRDGRHQPFGRGTLGYMSPQLEAGAAPTVADDMYALGALLYFAATGAEPSQAPHAFALLNRLPTLINPATGAALERVIARCIEADPCRRFRSMEALDSALARLSDKAPVRSARPRAHLAGKPDARASRRFRDLARRLGHTLCRASERAPHDQGLVWVSTHSFGGGSQSRDINTGCPGSVLAMAELVSQLGDPEHREVLAQGARWLATTVPVDGFSLPGLYVGEAGVGSALLRAGQVLGDDKLVAAAAERGRWVARQPHASPDLFNGTAGRLRFHLLLFDETKAAEHLRDAVAASECLHALAQTTSAGEVRWVIPPGYGDLSGQFQLGYAHGAAGIADALLDLFEVTGEGRFLALAQGAARWLMRVAVPSLDQGDGLSWPVIEGEPPTPAFWCHGATGIGRFFLHAFLLDALPRAIEFADRAARTVAYGMRWCNPTQCHGLSGNIEFLLDMFQATGEQRYLAEAHLLARLLEAFAVERQGLLLWPSESPDEFTPDYTVGYAGVLVCLLRLCNPECLPHQLSRRGFGRRDPGGVSHARNSCPIWVE
jgi:serine/threonine protein kinase